MRGFFKPFVRKIEQFMNKILLLTLLGFTYIFNMATAQKVENIDEVIVLEKRIQTPYSEQSRSIQIITAEEIQNAPSYSIQDLLNYYAGIDIRQRGPNGVQADAGIRGGTFEQVLILLNGVKISDPQTGHHSLNLPVDIENIERIEILKGPGARIFGQNAFAGAINIITKTPEENSLKAQISYGENALFGGKLSAAHSTESLDQYFSFSHDQSDGYKYNTDYKRTNIYYQSKLNLKKGSLGLSGGFTAKEFGANGFYASPDFMDQFEAVQNSLVTLNYSSLLSDKVSLKANMYWRRNQDEYIFIRNNPDFFRNFHISNIVGAEVNTSIYNKLGSLGLGVDMNKVWLSSNNLGQRTREVISLFAEQRFNLFNDKFNITPGIQFNYYTDFDPVFLPGLDVGYQITEHFSIYGNVGYTYRIPSYTDLYYNGPTNHGNEELQAENALTYELGIKTRKVAGVDAQLSFFHRAGNNIIDWIKNDPADPYWVANNILELTHYGIDASFGVSLPALLKKQKYWLEYINLGITYIESEAKTDFEESRYALENLKYQFTSNLRVNYIPGKLFQTVSARYFDRINLDDYFVANTRLTWQMKRFSVFINVSNIFNETYKETNLVTMPGRWTSGGLVVKLK